MQPSLFPEMNIINMKVREPSTGYNTEHKQRYREDLYRHIQEAVCDNIHLKRLLFMPSNTDGEIKQALSIGIREENMWACDDNPAMLATAKWRKKYPKINILGSKLGRAIERLKEKNIKIDIVNLDLCTNLSQWMFDDTANLINSLMGDEILFAITLLKGRESSSETTLAKMLFKDMRGTADRISIVFNYLLTTFRIRGKILVKSEYSSKKFKMCYGLQHFVTEKTRKNERIEVYKTVHQDVKKVLAIDDAFHNVVDDFWEMHGKKRMDRVHEIGMIKSSLKKQYWENADKIMAMKNDLEHNLKFDDYKTTNAGYCIYLQHEAVWDFNTMTQMPNHRIG